MTTPAATIIERVREIHRSYQEQIDAKRALIAEPSTTHLGSGPISTSAALTATTNNGTKATTTVPKLVLQGTANASSPSKGADPTTSNTHNAAANPYNRFYAPSAFVGQWLDRHPDTTLKDLGVGHSAMPLRSFLGGPADPVPVGEPAGFAGLRQMAAPQATATTGVAKQLQGSVSDKPTTNKTDDDDLDAPNDLELYAEDDKEGLADLVALGSAAEVNEWLKAVRELQAEGRTAASDWSAAEQAQVEAMVQEELKKTQQSIKLEDDKGYQRMLTLQTIAEQLAVISKRTSFNEMPASDATIDEYLDALHACVEDWYLEKRDQGGAGEGTKAEVKSVSRKNKVNQISSGLASAAAHEGLLLTAQQLDQVLNAFYEQDQRKQHETTDSNGNPTGGGMFSPVTQRAVVRLNRQLSHALAREDAIRRVMNARNKALTAEIMRLRQMLETAAGYGYGGGGVASMGGANGARSPQQQAMQVDGYGGVNLAQMMADHSAAAGVKEDYGIEAILRNRGAVESLNSITFVVAEALSRKRMRTLQGQVEKLRAALTSMKAAYTTASERLQGLSIENTRLRSDLDDFAHTFDKWKAVKEQQDAERRRLVREGGTELVTQKEVMNLVIQRCTALVGQLVRSTSDSAAAATSASSIAFATAVNTLRKEVNQSNSITSPNNRRGSLLPSATPAADHLNKSPRLRSMTTTSPPPTTAMQGAQQLGSASALQKRLSLTPNYAHELLMSGPSSRRGSGYDEVMQSIDGDPQMTSASVISSKQRAAMADALAAVTAQQGATVKGSMRAVRQWVTFILNTMPSDSAKMLLGDLDNQAVLSEEAWEERVQALAASVEGDGAVTPSNGPIGAGKGVGVGASAVAKLQQAVSHFTPTTSPSTTTLAPNGTTTDPATGPPEPSDSAIVEALSHRLDQTICEVKDKFREERFMRTTIKYFVQKVEEMCAGTYKEDPSLEERDEALGGASKGTTLTGVRSPLDKYKPGANVKAVKVFPPKAITVPDTEYGYAWTDETDSLQRLFATLKAVLIHEVERTETTNAIVGALERYNTEGPSFRNQPLLPPISAHSNRDAVFGGTNTSSMGMSKLAGMMGGVGGGNRRISSGEDNSPFGKKPSLNGLTTTSQNAKSRGDPNGFLALVRQANEKEDKMRSDANGSGLPLGKKKGGTR